MIFYAFCSEQSHIGLMGPVRTKILVTLVTQFGGELRNGKIKLKITVKITVPYNYIRI